MPGLAFSDSEDAFLRYSYYESSSGRLLVLMSRRGVVDVILGDEKLQMLLAAAKRFPATGFVPDRGAHAEWVAAVVTRFEMPGIGVVVPVDLGFGYGLRAAG